MRARPHLVYYYVVINTILAVNLNTARSPTKGFCIQKNDFRKRTIVIVMDTYKKGVLHIFQGSYDKGNVGISFLMF